AIPVVMQKGKTFISLFALDANAEFKYPKYFSVLPAGPRPKAAFTNGYFQIASAQHPKPTTVALAAEDAEFSRNACDGARENSDRYGVKIIYDKNYPPNTTDYTPIVRALQRANADLVRFNETNPGGNHACTTKKARYCDLPPRGSRSRRIPKVDTCTDAVQ